MARTRRSNPKAGWRNRRLYLPAYRYTEAARLAGTTAQTITRWYRGYDAPGHHMRAVLPSDGSPLLSYLQLVEVAFVATFRRHGVKLETLRRAHEYCVKTLNSEHPFAQLRFKTDGVHLLHTLAEHEPEDQQLENTNLIVTDAAGQLVWGAAVSDRISQFDYEDDVALRWHPRGHGSIILIDPRIAFGAPIIGTSGVPTWVIKDRYVAEEELDEIAEDFGLSRAQIVEALAFEDVAVTAAA